MHERAPRGEALRLGLVIDRLDPGRGGAESYLVGLARFLTERGHDVHLLAQRFGSIPAGTPVRVPGRRRPRPWRDLSFDRAAAAVARSLGLDLTLGVRHTPSADVFQPHGGVYSEAAAAQTRSAGRGRSRHGLGRALSLKHRALLRLERRQAERDGVTYVALSSRVRDHMIESYRLADRDPPVLLYNGVDLEQFRPRPDARSDARRRLGLEDGDLAVLFVAHNFRLKGLQHVVAALGRLREPRARLVVVGRGDPAPFQSAIERHGLRDSTTFVGVTDDPTRLYGSADVLAHPTYYDPCSCVCLEALACGLPVITTRLNGVGELIDEHGGGEVIDDAPDEAALVDALGRVFADAAHRRALGQAARALAERHDERDAFAAMEAILVGAAAERRR